MTQLNKQIERDKTKAIRLWKQEVRFDASGCIELGRELVSNTA